MWIGTCEFCLGNGCEKCEKQGERVHYRCPASMTNEEGRRALEYACAMEMGFLPSEGSYGKQVHSGMNCINLVRMEKAKIERAAMDKAGAAGN